MATRVLGSRREMGASALRRDLKARVDSSNETISSSIACRMWSLDSAKLVCMKEIARERSSKARSDYRRHTANYVILSTTPTDCGHVMEQAFRCPNHFFGSYAHLSLYFLLTALIISGSTSLL
jgi:hypothetical protein